MSITFFRLLSDIEKDIENKEISSIADEICKEVIVE